MGNKKNPEKTSNAIIDRDVNKSVYVFVNGIYFKIVVFLDVVLPSDFHATRFIGLQTIMHRHSHFCHTAVNGLRDCSIHIEYLSKKFK